MGMLRQENTGDITKEELKKEIVNNIRPPINIYSIHNKEFLRLFYKSLCHEQWRIHKQRLIETIDTAMEYSIDGSNIDPENIKLEIRLINNNDSYLNDLYFFWNLFWWSVPYSKNCGRQIRLLLWDIYHDAPFGLINLQSPILKLTARNRYLRIDSLSNKDIAYWINQSMYAQRIGALPPYNELLGAKMVALTLATKDIRRIYENKYKTNNNRVPTRLLFITTTAAYGKSSIYDRLKIRIDNNHYYEVFKFIGYTSGYGTCHIPEALYIKIKQYLNDTNINIKRRFEFEKSPSPKLRLLRRAFQLLSLPDLTFHNIRKGVYICGHVSNLLQVIHNNEEPNWYNFSFNGLEAYWKERWCIPRSKRLDRWKYIDIKKIISEARTTIESI